MVLVSHMPHPHLFAWDDEGDDEVEAVVVAFVLGCKLLKSVCARVQPRLCQHLAASDLGGLCAALMVCLVCASAAAVAAHLSACSRRSL